MHGQPSPLFISTTSGLGLQLATARIHGKMPRLPWNRLWYMPHSNAQSEILLVNSIEALVPDKDEFVIVACDGIWDVASSKQCADFVQQLLVEGESDLGIICEEALDTCLERNSKDNMTILVVGLPGMKTANGAMQFQNALVGRRAYRLRQSDRTSPGDCS